MVYYIDKYGLHVITVFVTLATMVVNVSEVSDHFYLHVITMYFYVYCR